MTFMELQQISLENICENTVWTLTNFSINHILREINLYQIFEDLISRKKVTNFCIWEKSIDRVGFIIFHVFYISTCFIFDC